MKLLKQWLQVGVLWLLAMSLAQAGAGTERLQRFYHDVQSLRADFEQTVTDGQGKVLQQAKGTMMLQRPGKFRWEYRAPHAQTIVADGKKVWLYDPELAQVTVKSQSTALGGTPAQLLSSAKPLEESFKTTELSPRDGLEWVELAPKANDASFESVSLGFDAKGLSRMEMVDGFGQTTRLSFRNVERNPRLKSDLFQFTPPKGVDVVGE